MNKDYIIATIFQALDKNIPDAIKLDSGKNIIKAVFKNEIFNQTDYENKIYEKSCIDIALKIAS